MLLDRVGSPADLRALSYEELDQLAAEIRDFIVDAVSANGGHLGSNLGAVELTLAVHRVFDSPQDIVLWDTGHQAYVHKIVTGRRDFSTLRQRGGLSGYPNRDESEHDWIENSHASTIISYAHGLAVARRAAGRRRPPHRRGHRRRLDDRRHGLRGAQQPRPQRQQGDHHPERQRPLLRADGVEARRQPRSPARQPALPAQARPARAPAPARCRCRQEPRAGVEGFTAGAAGDVRAAGVLREPRRALHGPVRRPRRRGPRAGAAHTPAAYDGPIVVHVLTQKGRGYAPAENDPIKRLHDIGPLAKPGSYTAAFTEALIKEAEDRPEVVAITAAMPDSTGLLPFAERFPGRLIDVGIAEQHAVTAAAGMAMGGLRPVVAIYSTFLTRAFDQVNLDVGLHGQPVVFAIDRAGITGDDGAIHHGVLDMVLLTKVPGMTCWRRRRYQELGVMLHDALEITTGPVAIRFPKTPAAIGRHDEVGHGLARPQGRARAPTCASSPSARCSPPPRTPPSARRRGHRGDGVGRPRASSRSTPRCSPTPPPTRGGDHRGRPARRRRRLGDRRSALMEHAADVGRRPAGARPRRARRSTSPQASPTRSSPTSASTPPASPRRRRVRLRGHLTSEAPRQGRRSLAPVSLDAATFPPRTLRLKSERPTDPRGAPARYEPRERSTRQGPDRLPARPLPLVAPSGARATEKPSDRRCAAAGGWRRAYRCRRGSRRRRGR